jgi:hypothetical protein
VLPAGGLAVGKTTWVLWSGPVPVSPGD